MVKRIEVKTFKYQDSKGGSHDTYEQALFVDTQVLLDKHGVGRGGEWTQGMFQDFLLDHREEILALLGSPGALTGGQALETAIYGLVEKIVNEIVLDSEDRSLLLNRLELSLDGWAARRTCKVSTHDDYGKPFCAECAG